MSERTIEAAAISRAIEDFIAEPQCDRDYRGNIAPGFEMRRDLPKHFGPGIWFSDVAVSAILAALREPKSTVFPDDLCAACGEPRREHVTPGGTRYGPTTLCGVFIPRERVSPGKVEGWREAIEAAAKCAEQEVDTYYEGMSAIDVRLSNRRGPKWHDGRAIAKAIRALPSPPSPHRPAR